MLWIFAACLHAPPEVSEGTAWAVDGQTVTVESFQERLHALTGPQEGWYCAETNTGGITGWTQVDADGVRWRVRLVTDGKGSGGTIERE